ncbi:tetratricopeptide repeat protein [Streptomyces sp. NPDC005499]|uniref:tetratricopeptide repeat protein n=1 Tax=Streptomyces sp. NPDC005499 TaxID=3154883 RepID=UPI0033A4979F
MSNEISGGVYFNAVIQGRDITVKLPPQITPALSGLPTASPTFSGRETDLKELVQTLAPAAGQQRTVPAASQPTRTAVAGLAGVGKTELVIQCAVQALHKPDWFPGGVLFVDMFGYDRDRIVAPEQALESLLRALGMPGEHMPVGLQGRCRLYRSVLAAFAERGRRILVVIDNVSTAEQARPLLPTDGINAALITSRHTLDIDARLHDLRILDEPASIELIRRALLEARGPNDTRVQDAPEHAASIARLCAGLPLALRIAAALLGDTPTRPLASLAQALDAGHTRLRRLRREDRAVRAAFDLSYEHLDDQPARLFRLLPLNPGPDMSTECAAHVADTDPGEIEELLQDLARAHLIEAGHVWGRWRLHDLVRLYADEHGRIHPDTDERTTAQTRLFGFYTTSSQAANTHLDTESPKPATRFGDRDAALAWLDSERVNLLAAAAAAPSFGHPKASKDLADALSYYFNCRGYVDDSLTIATTALTVCRQLGDRRGQGAALKDRGNALHAVRRFEEAFDDLTAALATFRELGNRHGEADALNSRGNVGLQVRRLEEAFDDLTAALATFRELGNRHGEAAVLLSLANLLHSMGRFEQAIEDYTTVGDIFGEFGDRHGEAIALNGRGNALHDAERFEEAIEDYAAAVAIHRELGERHREAMALNGRGNALHDAERFDEAIADLTAAVAIHRELAGDRHSAAMALNDRGNALHDAERFEEAIADLTAAAAIYRELGERHGEASALNNRGRALEPVFKGSYPHQE